MFQRIPGNVEEDSGGCSIRFRGDSGGCTRKFWGIFERIPGNVHKDSGGMLKKISGNLNLDLFCEILLQIFVAYRHFAQNQFQKLKLQNTEYKTLYTD